MLGTQLYTSDRHKVKRAMKRMRAGRMAGRRRHIVKHVDQARQVMADIISKLDHLDEEVDALAEPLAAIEASARAASQ